MLNIFDSIMARFNEAGGDWEMISVILLVTLSALGGLWRLALWWYHRRRSIQAEKDLFPFFTLTDIKKATQYYVPTQFQSNPPSQFNELRESNHIVARERLIPFFLNKAFKPGQDDQRFFMILAGSGMGKTTFMLNLYLNYVRQRQFGRARYKIRLIPLGYPDLLQHIDTIEDKENTILLLDGLDEDNQAVRKYKRRLDRIINKVQHFRVVVFTCRTQFFPSEDEEPQETGIRLYGSRHSFLTFAKMYISPFDEKDIQAYLAKRFGRFQKGKKEKAWKIIAKSPSLMVRPMILSYIDDLLEEDKAYDYVPHLYQTVIQKWIEREGGRVPAEKRKHFQEELYRFSREIALNIYANRKNRNGLFISEKEINTFADRHQIKLGEMEMKSRSLLNRNMSGQYKFAHKSILEYFIATECIENERFASRVSFEGMDQARTFYRELLFLDKTLPFLQSLDDGSWCILSGGTKEKLSPASLSSGDIRKIKGLYLREIDDLTPISPLTDLEQLWLEQTSVEDLTPISDFHHLEALYLNGSAVMDINPLREMENLEILELEGCKVRNLQALGNLNQLRRLSIRETEVKSLAQISGLTQLRHLDAAHTAVRDLDPLKKLKAIENLYLDFSLVSSLNPIRELKQLKELSLSATRVKNLTPVKGMDQLRRLDISVNAINSIKGLKELKKLKVLRLSQEQIDEWGEEELKKLLPTVRIDPVSTISS